MYQIEPGAQLALFRLAPWYVAIDGTAYFTRDVMNHTNWAAVSIYGLLSPSPAYAVQGLRPYFCLK